MAAIHQPSPAHKGPASLPADAALVRESGESLRRSLLKMLGTALVVLGSVLLIHQSPLRDVLGDIQSLKETLSERGVRGPLFFAGIAAVLVAGGLPRLLMSTVAGALFGFNVGFLAAWSAAMLGAYLNFLFVRWGARKGVQRLLRVSPRLQAILYHPNWMSVVLVRQLPMWGVAQNMGLALTDVKHSTYVLGTLCGILPSTVIVTLIGSGVGKATLAEALRNVGWAMLLLAVLGCAAWYQWRKRNR